MNSSLSKIVIFLFLIGLFYSSCQNDSKESSETYEKKTEGLDISRTNPIKNTPSREATSGEETNDSEQAATVSTPNSSGKVLNTLPEGIKIPEGMVFIPGGTLDMGSEKGLPREQPVVPRSIKGFFMDVTPVTVAQFRKFVKATGYITQAESFGDAAIFDLQQQTWILKESAYWEYPRGKDNEPAPADHPVTQVSFNDAIAYCNWANKRLPTEAEWEHAARNGANSRTQYSWGEEIQNNDGTYKANVWQGVFPAYNTGEDGFMYTSPVGYFNETKNGLKDMSGNVWEWCLDWYQSYDPNQPERVQTAEPERVMRGGSFMCHPGYCHGYRVSGRSGTTPETGLFHVGFRTVKDI